MTIWIGSAHERFSPLNLGLDGQEKLEEISGTRFNSCLLNMYRDGKDSLSWHSDNEKPYGPTPIIG